MDKYTLMQQQYNNDDLGDVFDQVEDQAENMNDDLQLDDGDSSSDEEVEQVYQEKEVNVKPNNLEQIVMDSLSKNLKNEFEIFEMTASKCESKECYLKVERESQDIEVNIMRLQKKECHVIDLKLRWCQ